VKKRRRLIIKWNILVCVIKTPLFFIFSLLQLLFESKHLGTQKV